MYGFADRWHGPQQQDLAGEVGDFIVLRGDGYWAYQLAVVVDDGAQGITQVVRGADLLDSTPRQLYLQDVLGLPHPGFLHVPVVNNDSGEKLSKQTGALAFDTGTHAAELLASALLPAARFLGLDVRADEPGRLLAASRSRLGAAAGAASRAGIKKPAAAQTGRVEAGAGRKGRRLVSGN